ncbi:MAG: DUF86 domain-containing protein [Alphaproteobacteria bacterium]|nr:DUF86 domain-containing protein [Alphaproteobacteria bacterium]
MSPNDRMRLRHIVEALNSAFRFIEGRQRNDLDRDTMLLFALVRTIEIAGEAARRVSPAGREELPDVPWDPMIGMRHRLVHAYFDVDGDILWTTVTEAAPSVAERLSTFLGEE